MALETLELNRNSIEAKEVYIQGIILYHNRYKNDFGFQRYHALVYSIHILENFGRELRKNPIRQKCIFVLLRKTILWSKKQYINF